MKILFKIRNRFAHALFISAKESTLEFDRLREAEISNKFLKNLPNDSRKFQLIVSKCIVELMEICRKLDPSSVQTFDLVGDIKEIHEFE